MKNKYQPLNNHGQALIEFVLILPVIIFLLFSIYDFGMIFNRKNKLENSSTDILELYRSGKTITEINNIYPKINIEIKEEEDYQTLIIKDSLKLITPGFNRLFGNPYKITVTRYIPNE